MKAHRYTLEPYKGTSTRYHCPACNSRNKTFARYIDTETGGHVAANVGRCNRESNCGYHYTPKQYFQDNGSPPQLSFDRWPLIAPKPIIPKQRPPSYIPPGIFKDSLTGYDENHLVSFLKMLFGDEATATLIEKYFIGTSKHWKGSTVFWQIDQQGKIRAGKIMLYNPNTGKRVKEPYNHIQWVHSVISRDEFILNQCLFGEHLLQDSSKPAAIVESEKTAIIASVYLPQFIWLATGGLHNLTAYKCKALKGRKVVLFPDVNGFEKWKEKAKGLATIATFIVSDLLERKATDKERGKGYDLADYLLSSSPPIKSASTSDQLPTEPIQNTTTKPFAPEASTITVSFDEVWIRFHGRSDTDLHKEQLTERWVTTLDELSDLTDRLKSINTPIRINGHTTITDPVLFAESHIAIARHHIGNETYLPYLDRLVELREVISNTHPAQHTTAP